MEKLSLSELPGALKRAGYDSLPYRRIYAAVLDGELADHAVRDNGRWYVPTSSLASIAKALGLNPSKAAA
jgi:hypothetical protein